MKFYCKKSIAIVVVAALSACAQFGKQAPLEEPTAPALSKGKSAEYARGSWWRQLGDKKLDALIERAIHASPDLKAAKARLEQAQARLGITEAADKTQVGLSIRGIGAYTEPKPKSGQGDPNHTLLLANTALQGSWSFDFWGKNREEITSVLGERQAVVYEAQQVRLELAQAVAAQYFTWQALTEQDALLAQRIVLAEKKRLLVQQRIDAKLMAPESIYAIELALQQLKLEKSVLEQNRSKVRHGLSALTGQSPDGLMISEPGKMVNPPVLAVNKIHADLLAARPDIAAQKALLNARTHTVKSTEAEFYPDIELKVLAGLAHIDAFNLVKGRNSGVLGVIPALNLPIFTSGALQSKLAGKRAQYNEQVAVYDRTVLNAMRSAADAVSDYQNLLRQKTLWDKMAVTVDQSLRSSKKRVAAGLDNGLTGLEKQDELAKVDMQRMQHRAELLTAWSNVHAQLGGGFRPETD